MGPWHGLDRKNDETGKHIVISTSLAGSCISMWLPAFFNSKFKVLLWIEELRIIRSIDEAFLSYSPDDQL